MDAEIIAIGDELTSGQRLDTNSQWLSKQLGDLGVRVLYHTTVGDDLPANIDVFRIAARRAQLVVCTGGLGPTADDLTRQAIAEAMDEPLVLNEDCLEHIRSMFSRRNREMPETNRVQAMFPASSAPIPNPHGTAPGIDILMRSDSNACRTFALPGVPAEMREMWTESVRPALLEYLGAQRRFIQHHVIKCFGAGESHLEQMLPDMIRRGRQPTIGITASKATISLRIQALAESEAECQLQISTARQTILDSLGHLVYAEGEVELHEAVSDLLSTSEARVAMVEVGGGILNHWMTESKSASFAGGRLFADEDAAFRWLSHRDETTSKPSLTELAREAAKEHEAEYGVAVVYRSTTGDDLALLAVATPDDASEHESPTLGHPDIVDIRTAKNALNLLRKRLARI